MMFDYSAQIGAEYDKSAPFCPHCGARMTFLVRLGGKIVWTVPAENSKTNPWPGSATVRKEIDVKKSKILLNLRRLRLDIENGNGALSDEQAYLLIDVCRALELHDSETAYVAGDQFTAILDRPIPYALVTTKADARSLDLAPAAG